MKNKNSNPPHTQSVKAKRNTNNIVICDHARLDPSHCLADGLFKPLLRGRNDAELDVRYKYKDHTFHWHGPELLGINEQSVFLAIHRLAATAGSTIFIDSDVTDTNQLEARTKLKLAYGAEKSACIVIETDANEITRSLGRQVNGQSGKRVIESLARMSAVQFSIYNAAEPASLVFQSQLISVAESGRTLYVGINPCLSKAIRQKPSTYVDMREQRALSSDISKRLHVWLSSWANTKGKDRDQRIGMDKLICHVWGDSATGDALYTRRKKLLAAISELNALMGWSCVLNANDILHVQRTPVGISGAIVCDATNEMS